MAADGDSELLTATQAAEALSASSQPIRNWIRDGRLAEVRIGNRFLIPRSEIERLRGRASAPVGESPREFAHKPRGCRSRGRPELRASRGCWGTDAGRRERV